MRKRERKRKKGGKRERNIRGKRVIRRIKDNRMLSLVVEAHESLSFNQWVALL